MPATIAGSHLGPDTHANRPAANAAGQPIGAIYKCTTHNLVYRTDGSTWSTYVTEGTGLTDPMTTRGDIIVRNSSNVSARLAVGAANRVLRSDGTDPSWGQVLPADLDVSADNTTADATTGHHGLLPKLGGGTTNFLRADGSWAAPGGGGGGTFPLGVAAPDTIPASPGAEDEEFEGTADALPTDWAWVSAAPTFKINSYLPSIFFIERTDTTERKARKSSFTMAATSGLWIKFSAGGHAAISGQYEFIIYDSASSNGYGFGIHNGNVAIARDSNAGTLANRGSVTLGNRGDWVYMGVMRVSNTWQTWLSMNGVNWIEVQSADTRSFTVDRLELRWSTDSAIKQRGAVDWIRYRADNEFPRP